MAVDAACLKEDKSNDTMTNIGAAELAITAAEDEFNGYKIVDDFFTTNPMEIMWDISNTNSANYACFTVADGNHFEFHLSMNADLAMTGTSLVYNVSLLDNGDAPVAISSYNQTPVK